MRIVNTRIQNLRVVGQSSGAVATDTYFNLVTLLLPGNGTNGQTNNTFLDSSTNNFAVTRNGNTTQGTFSPFSQTGWSNYFDGVASTPMYFADNDAFTFNADFTVEAWVYLNNTSAFQVVVGKWDVGTQEWLIGVDANGVAEFHWAPYSVGGPAIESSSGAVLANQWTHIAAVRSGSTITLYVNGISVGTRTNGTAGTNYTSLVTVGYLQYLGGDKLAGYVSNLRIVKGTAVYTGAFTPSSVPLTAVSGTSLLTCQTNRFVDNSTNNFTPVVNSVVVNAFAPFDPTAAYSTTTVGGSGYFDGTGDYLATPSNAAFTFGTGDLTLECWIYQTATSSGTYRVIFSDDVYGSTGGYTLYSYNNALNLWRGGGEIIAPAGTITLNAWNHIAWTRSGSSNRLFINGNQVGSTTTDSTNYTGSLINIGASQAATFLFFGYISNARALKGTALYTANFTVPTAPLTAIANTSLLLNYTNGGIADAAAKNVLETVGGAAISTAQSKFGGSSMAFDGSGDYLLLPNPQTQNFVYGTGNFTIEFWFYMSALAGSGNFYVLYDGRPSATTGAYVNLAINNATPESYVNGATVITGSALSANTWYHFAYARSGSSTKMFINGTQVGSTYTDNTNYINAANRPVIGTNGFSIGSSNFNGYINDLRITRGYARYTANFTPPTTAFPTQ